MHIFKVKHFEYLNLDSDEIILTLLIPIIDHGHRVFDKESIIDSGAAFPLDKTQIPDFNLKPRISSEHFFAEYDPAVLFNDDL